MIFEKCLPFLAILALSTANDEKCSMVDYQDKSGRTGKCCVYWDDEQDSDRIFFHPNENDSDNTTRINEIHQNAIHSTILDSEINKTEVIQFVDTDNTDQNLPEINKTTPKPDETNKTTLELPEMDKTSPENKNVIQSFDENGAGVVSTTEKASEEMVKVPNRNNIDTPNKCPPDALDNNGRCVIYE